jgi:ornithine cyclodeaminase
MRTRCQNGARESSSLVLTLTYLNAPDVARLALTDGEILAAVEGGLRAQGEGRTVIEPRVHLAPGRDDEGTPIRGHFNVLRGYVAPLRYAGVKVVGDYVDNYRVGLPSEMGLLNLFDPATGRPLAVIDAAGLTDMRTGAVTAIGAKHLARRDSRVLGHIGARGTAYWNVRLLDRLFDFEEIRVHSRREESREAFAARLSADLGKRVIATTDWESCVRDADIVVEASRLEQPQPLLKTAWIKPSAFVVPYGTMSAVELDLTDIMSKIVVDDWGQCATGRFGALRAHVEAGKLSAATLYAELGEIVAGRKPGRERDDETILLWHRGLSLSDIALGAAMLDKARRLGIGQTLDYA